MNAPQWLSVGEAVVISGYNAEYITTLIRRGRIAAEKLKGGHEWLIDRDSFKNYVDGMKSLGPDKYNPHREPPTNGHAPKKRKQPKARVAFKS